MAEGDTARLYHRLSSCGPEKDVPSIPADHPLVVQGFVANDFGRWPTPCKVYPAARPAFSSTRTFTIFLTSAVGTGLSAGKRIVPFPAR